MKNLIKIFLLSACAATAFTACSDWTETEAKDGADLTHTNKSEAYYAQLRDYKKTDHSVAFGWFGNWTGTGVTHENSLAGLPDSTDFVSLWGNWKNPTEAMLKDLRFVQKTKGTKVLISCLVFDIGDQITPTNTDKNLTWKEWRHKFWGWGNDEASQIAATEKYANAICDTIAKYGYDGFDLDAEPSYAQPFQTDKELWQNAKVMEAFVKTMGKRIGPKSGTDKMFVIDGEPDAMAAEYGEYFNYFILQAYSSSGNSDLNSRFATQATHFQQYLTPEQVAKKLIVCENFENYAGKGGVNFWLDNGQAVPSLLGMAYWNPVYNNVTYRKGGVGTYHMEYEYNVSGKTGNYPFLRKAIQIMNPSIQ